MLVCPHSYGFKVTVGSTEEEKVFNIIKRDTPLPAMGTTEIIFDDLILSTASEWVDSVRIPVRMNDSYEDVVDLDECKSIFEDAPIKFEPPLRGETSVFIEFKINVSGILEFTLVEKITGVRRTLTPKRLSTLG